MGEFTARGSDLWLEGVSDYPYAQIDRGYGPKIVATLNLGLHVRDLGRVCSDTLWRPLATRYPTLEEDFGELPTPDPGLSFGSRTSFRALGRSVVKDLRTKSETVLTAVILEPDHLEKALELAGLLNDGLAYERAYQGLQLMVEAVPLLERYRYYRVPDHELQSAPGTV